MPHIPKRERRQQPAETLANLDPDLRRDLEKGSSFFQQYPSREAMEAAWNQLGDELLTDWIRDSPGTRPFAWWVFEHGKERPLNPGKVELPWVREQSRFGFVHTSMWSDGESYQQDETEYLEEHGLLSKDELSRIPVAEDYPDDLDEGLKILRRMCRGPRLKQTTK